MIYTVILLSLLSTFVATEQSKKLPSNIPQRLYCFGCIATVTEAEKILVKRRVTKSNRQLKVMEMLESICQPNNFVSYEYSPPKMTSACQLLLDNHEDEIETAFIKNEKNLKTYICNTVSQACDGIDTTEERNPSQNADIDLSADGSTKTVEINPKTGKVETGKKKVKKEAKTISKKSKSKKDKKERKQKQKKQPGTKEGVEKGSLHHLNVDINDPASMQSIMDQVKKIRDEM